MDLRELSKTHMQLNMCMLGARSVGKTTIMTAIFDDSRSSNGLSNSKTKLTTTQPKSSLLAVQQPVLAVQFVTRFQAEHIFIRQ